MIEWGLLTRCGCKLKKLVCYLLASPLLTCLRRGYFTTRLHLYVVVTNEAYTNKWNSVVRY